MSFEVDFIKSANDLIRSTGREITIAQATRTVGSDFNTSTTTSNLKVFAREASYILSRLGGTPVLAGDKKFILDVSGLSTAPNIGDVVTDGADKTSIVYTESFRSGTDLVRCAIYTRA